MLGVFASVLAVVCKRMKQQLPAMLEYAVHREKDTTHKTLETICDARAWPQERWASCASGPAIFLLRFGIHGTKEMLRVIGSKF